MQEFLGAIALGPQAAAWYALQFLLMILAALVAGRSPWRRAASLPLVLALLLLPCVAPLPPLHRALLACLGMLGTLKAMQLGFEARWQSQHAVWHGLAPFDVSTARRAAPAFDLRLFAFVCLHAALLAACVFALLRLPATPDPAWLALRLLLGAGML